MNLQEPERDLEPLAKLPDVELVEALSKRLDESLPVEKRSSRRSSSPWKIGLLAAGSLLICLGMGCVIYLFNFSSSVSSPMDTTSLQATPQGLPALVEPISVANASQAQALACFGRGHMNMMVPFDLGGAVVISSDGRKVAVSSSLGLEVYDTTSLELLFSPKDEPGLPQALAWAPDGVRLAAGWSGGAVRIWDVNTGQQLQLLESQSPFFFITSLAWSEDGTRLAAGDGYRDVVKVWNAQTNSEIFTLQGQHAPILSLAWSPDGEMLAVGGGINVRVVDTTNLQEINSSRVRIHSMDWLAEGGLALVTGKGELVIWEDVRQNTPRILADDQAVSVAWSSKGTYLAAGEQDGSIQIWDTGNWQRLHKLEGHIGPALALAWSTDGAQLASMDKYGTLQRWNEAEGTQLNRLEGYLASIQKIEWAPDGTQITIDMHHAKQVWDMVQGRPIGLTAMDGIEALDIPGKIMAPNGDQWAEIDGDRSTILVLDNPESEQGIQLTMPEDTSINWVAWSPDSKLLAALTEEKTIRVWDVKHREELYVLEGHTREPTGITWSPDGKLIVSGDPEFIRLWDAATKQLLHETSNLQSRGVFSPIWSPDNKRLAWIGGDGRLCLLGIPETPLPTVTPTPTPSPTPTPTSTPAPAPSESVTYQVGECMTISFPGGKVIECVTSITVRPDNSLQFNVLWGAQTGRGVVIKKTSDSNNKNLYLTDDLGNRLDHLGGGGAMAENVEIPNGESVEGWFLFPAPDPKATYFIFHDDDNLVQTAPIPKQW